MRNYYYIELEQIQNFNRYRKITLFPTILLNSFAINMKWFISLLAVSVAIINGKNINVQINSKEVAELISDVMKNSIHTKMKTEVVQRTGKQITSYKNPYHPEDDLEEKVDGVGREVNQRSFRAHHKYRDEIFRDKVKKERSLELENNVFLSSGEQIVSEDELIDVSLQKSINNRVPIFRQKFAKHKYLNKNHPNPSLKVRHKQTTVLNTINDKKHHFSTVQTRYRLIK